MTQLTLMLLVPDRARADIMLKEDRIYYRFATESTTEDGDLPGLRDRFDIVGQRLVEALKPLPGEMPAPADEIKVTLFVDNVLRPTADITEEAVRRVADELTRIDDVFAFVRGFA